jgi:sulfide:quinone oxidoreductase
MSNLTICVVGAGTAGLEGLLGARQALGPEANLRLIAPEREFRYRPMTPDSLFRPAPERGLAIADLVAKTGATWVVDRADAIRQDERSVLTRDGDTVPFDYLLLAPGARAARALRQGYVWQRGGDPGVLDLVISELLTGEVRSVAVVIPRGARWPLPAYELALVLAWRAAATDARVTLVTAEGRPLEALGPQATQAVCAELDAAGVHVIAGVEAVDAPPGHRDPPEPVDLILAPENAGERSDALVGKAPGPARLRLGHGSAAEFDRLISLPTFLGPVIAGVARDAAGFIEVDDALQVCDSDRVWAAGGCLAAALEHSALSARQADAAVAAIAAASDGAGARRSPRRPDPPELAGMLLAGQREPWLAENPAGTREPSTRVCGGPPDAPSARCWLSRSTPGTPRSTTRSPASPTAC